MNNLNEKSVGEIVAEDYRTASVFNNYKIDFCCNGNINFDEICRKKNVDPEKLQNEIKAVIDNVQDHSIDYSKWNLDVLADHIENTHHKYIQSRTPEIKTFLNKLCDVHGAKHPELLKVNELFSNSAGDLAMHMRKEELILFPYIRQMEKSRQNNGRIELPQFGSVNNPIQMMMAEHNAEGDRFRAIEELTNGYEVPSDGCTTYKVTLSMLKEFQEDLHLHIHLENNILFQKAIELEDRFTILE